MPAARPLAFDIHSVRSGLGAEKVVLNVVYGLAGRGHEIDLLIEDAEGDLSERLPAGVNLVDLGPATLNPVMEALLSNLSLLINLFSGAKADPCGKGSVRVALASFLCNRPPPHYAFRRGWKSNVLG